MRAVLRTAGLVAALAGSLAVTAPPAAADEGVFPFFGTIHSNCFGCGSATGSGYVCVVTPDGAACVYYPRARRAGITYNTSLNFTESEPTGVGCLLTGSASGTATGAINVTFSLTRLGSFFVITTSGDVNGAGVGALQVTSPLGVPCGGPVDAQIAGSIAEV
jgi:hypothetical protein